MISRSLVLLALFGSMALTISGQDVKYFKDDLARKQTNERGGSFKLVTERSGPIKTEKLMTMNDRVVWSRAYLDDVPVGKWEEFDKRGNLIEQLDFDMLVYGCEKMKKPETSATVDDENTEPFTIVETMPEFPGGQAELFNFLGKNVRYPKQAIDAGISGTVYMQGVVDKEGNWNTKAICEGAHPFLDHEAWRVLDAMPKWKPGTQRGKGVKVQYTLPIKFTLR